MKPYEKYKDSGVAWIGMVPEHWAVVALKRCVAIKITDGPHETPEFLLEGVPFISAEAVQNGTINFESKRGYISEYEDKRFSLKCKPRRDDIFIVKSGSTTGKVAIVKTDENFNIWSPLALVRANDFYEPNFLFHFLSSNIFQIQVQLFWSFGTQPNIGMNVLENLKVTRPQKSEQTAIARYLDQKTSEIDQLIAQKERLLALWEEEKTALINQAVTRGLDAGAKMKDSGVAWLGEVPEHWEVKRLKYVGEINPTKDFDFEYDTETLCTFLPMEKVSEEGEIDCSIKKPVSELVSGFTFFKKNDVIVAKITPCFENGKGAILEKLDTDFGFGSTEFHVIRPKNDVLGKFLYFLTKSEIFMNMGEAMMIGSAGQKRVPTDFIRNFTVSLPKLLEQTAIVRHIETQTARIQTQMNQTRKLIELLREYRATLISEVVTGKVKITE